MNNSLRSLRRRVHRDEIQRRNPVIDLYGIPITAFGNADNDAEIEVYVTPDLVKTERFEFKLKINNVISEYGGTSIGETALTLNSNYNINPQTHSHSVSGTTTSSQTLNVTGNATITPNPHTHTLQEGVNIIPTTIDDFRIYIEGIDMTPYFATQHGSWVNGVGIFPHKDVRFNFDVTEACNFVTEAQRKLIMSAGTKTITFSNNGMFSVTFILYLKASHSNR